MGRTSIDVDDVVHGELKKLKADQGLRKVGDVVKMLVDHYQGEGEAAGSDADQHEDADVPNKKRKVDVREPLYSLEILKERPGMVEYYTGLELSAVELLIRRFREVSLRASVFRPFTFCWLRCALGVFAHSSHAPDVGDQIRCSGATREQRRLPKAGFGGKSRDVPRSTEEKSHV